MDELSKPDKSLALRADMVVYEEREAGDFGESGYQRLEHLWEETWHAPRQADRYGPGIGAGMRTTPRRCCSGGMSPDRQCRRSLRPDVRAARSENAVGVDNSPSRQVSRSPGPTGHVRSASAGALGCDFSRLEAIWDSWWSVPSRKCPHQEEPSAVKPGRAEPHRGGRCKDLATRREPLMAPGKGHGEEPCAGHRCGGPSEVRKQTKSKPTHRRSRSWTGTEFKRVSKEWGPGWNEQDDQGFIINELNRMSLRGS